jgi:hypothetical protein
MNRKDTVLVIGLLSVGACLDRKTIGSADGAAMQDALAAETALLPGTGGAPGSDGAATPDDLRQPLDSPTIADMPITIPDGRPADGPDEDGGATGTGGMVATATGGVGATLPAT